MNLDILIYLCDQLTKDSTVKKKLKYFNNTTLYHLRNKIRYIEPLYGENSLEMINTISSVTSNNVLIRLLDKAKNGISYQEILSLLISFGYKEKESIHFIDELLDSGMFISELIPLIEKGDFINQVTNKLDNIGVFNSQIHQIKSVLSKFSKASNFVNSEIEDELPSTLDFKKMTRSILSKNIMFSDTFTIDKNISKDIIKGIKLLYVLSEKHINNRLTHFKTQFESRFGSEEISLVKILDPEIGIGYGDRNASGTSVLDLLTGINFEERKEKKKGSHTLFELLKNKPSISDEIVLDEKKYNQLIKEIELDVPDTFSCAIELGENHLNDTIINLKTVGTISASVLTSRYTDFSEEVYEFNQDVFLKEQELHDDQIVAEICYIPENESSNIIGRKGGRSYQINYLSGPSKTNSNSIDVEDLTISLVYGKFVLKSQKLNKEIIPRHSNPYNYHNNSMPVFNFLCDLQEERYQVIDLSLNTHKYAFDFQFIPRIIFKNMILSPKFWGIFKSDIEYFYLEKDQSKLVSLLDIWRKKIKMPDEIYLVNQAGDLYFNFKYEVSINAFIKAVKNKDRFLIKEFFYDDHKSMIRDASGQEYAHELIVSLYKQN